MPSSAAGSGSNASPDVGSVGEEHLSRTPRRAVSRDTVLGSLRSDTGRVHIRGMRRLTVQDAPLDVPADFNTQETPGSEWAPGAGATSGAWRAAGGVELGLQRRSAALGAAAAGHADGRCGKALPVQGRPSRACKQHPAHILMIRRRSLSLPYSCIHCEMPVSRCHSRCSSRCRWQTETSSRGCGRHSSHVVCSRVV